MKTTGESDNDLTASFWRSWNDKVSIALHNARHNYVYLYLTEFQSQNPFRFSCQSVKVITFSL